MSDEMQMEKIEIEGADAEVDSFAACITAVMKRWARGFDYSFVAGLTGAIFSPMLRKNESCSAWWTEGWNDSRIELLSKALGFTYRQSPEMSREEFEKEEKVPLLIERFWTSARDALKQGRMVLIGTWPCWSLATGWSDKLYEPEVACLADLSTLCKPHPLDKVYILTEAPAHMTRGHAIRESLKFGADVADGTFSRPGLEYGGKLYEAILTRLDEDSFCADCKDREWSCAVRTMAKIHGLAATASEFLTFAGEFLSRQVPQSEMTMAAKYYLGIAEAALPYVKKSNVEPNWKDKVFRNHLAKDVEIMEAKHVEAARTLRGLVGGL